MYDVKPITTAYATACGPACLAMLLKYYGIEVPLEQLIEECHTGIVGCSAKTLMDVGRSHGLTLSAWGFTANGILTQDRPAIIWWEYDHFVVFCGLNEAGEPVICNPMSGRFPISKETFERKFSGVVVSHGRPEDQLDSFDYFGESIEIPDYFND